MNVFGSSMFILPPCDQALSVLARVKPNATASPILQRLLISLLPITITIAITITITNDSTSPSPVLENYLPTAFDLRPHNDFLAPELQIFADLVLDLLFLFVDALSKS